MENCIFCKIIKKEIPFVKIWENENHLAILDVAPVSPGHTLIIPKKHEDYLFDLNNFDYKKLMLDVKFVSNILKSKLNPKKIGLIVEGFEVPHVHIHLIPINKGGELNLSKAKHSNLEELKKIADKILG